MKKLNTIAIFIFAIILVACNKNATSKLNGTWKMSEYIYNNSTIDLNEVNNTLSFESCDLETESYCNGTQVNELSYNLSGKNQISKQTFDLIYTITENNTVFTMVYNSTTTIVTVDGVEGTPSIVSCDSNCTSVFTIEELSNKKFVFSETDNGGNTHQYTFTKQ